MAEVFSLQYPQSLATYHEYSEAQRAVDYLSDNEFPVENLLIVGTDLKQLERVTGRLTWGRVLLTGLGSGLWVGLFIGLFVGIFAASDKWLSVFLGGLAFGAVFGVVFAALGYAMTQGRRDFSSVSQIQPSRYEVLVEHRFLQQAQTMLALLPQAPAGS